MGGVCTNLNSVNTFETTEPIKRGNKIITISRARTNVFEIKINNFIYKLLKCHNEIRKKYNLPELVENLDLHFFAEIYAKEFFKNKEIYIYKPNIYKGMYLGENVIISRTKEPEEIFKRLSIEEKDYARNSNEFSKSVAHFTQVISKDTTDIGIGLWADKAQEKYCTVILYYPIGNILWKKNI